MAYAHHARARLACVGGPNLAILLVVPDCNCPTCCPACPTCCSAVPFRVGLGSNSLEPLARAVIADCGCPLSSPQACHRTNNQNTTSCVYCARTDVAKWQLGSRLCVHTYVYQWHVPYSGCRLIQRSRT